MVPLKAPLFSKKHYAEIEVFIKRVQGLKIVYNQAWLSGGTEVDNKTGGGDGVQR